MLYFKFIFITVFVCVQFVNLTAQSTVSILKISIDDYSQFIGEKVKENEDVIMLALVNSQDTITIEKWQIKQLSLVDIKKVKVTKPLSKDKKIEKQDGEFLKGNIVSGKSKKEVAVIITNCNQQLKGYILNESESKILFILKSTKDTISVTKANVKSVNMKSDKFMFAKGRYHRKKAWVNSIGLYTGNLLFAWPLQSVVPPLNSMIDFKVYKFIHPNVGIGLGVDRKFIVTPQLGYERYSHYKFADVFAYSKVYLSDDRRRLFLEAKLGYGYALENEIVFGCPYCDESLPLAQRYTSGRMLQFGGGLEFASKRKAKWGINWAVVANRTQLEEDEYPKDGRTPLDGVISFSTKSTELVGLMVGVNIYL